jgi:hypothetical protein
MDITGRTNSLDEESQRLENWYLLLGELTDCLWYPDDLPGLLEGFCKILVLRAGYSHTEIFLKTTVKNPVLKRLLLGHRIFCLTPQMMSTMASMR